MRGMAFIALLLGGLAKGHHTFERVSGSASVDAWNCRLAAVVDWMGCDGALYRRLILLTPSVATSSGLVESVPRELYRGVD